MLRSNSIYYLIRFLTWFQKWKVSNGFPVESTEISVLLEQDSKHSENFENIVLRISQLLARVMTIRTYCSTLFEMNKKSRPKFWYFRSFSKWSFRSLWDILVINRHFWKINYMDVIVLIILRILMYWLLKTKFFFLYFAIFLKFPKSENRAVLWTSMVCLSL